jgi:hypothetical protein
MRRTLAAERLEHLVGAGRAVLCFGLDHPCDEGAHCWRDGSRDGRQDELERLSEGEQVRATVGDPTFDQLEGDQAARARDGAVGLGAQERCASQVDECAPSVPHEQVGGFDVAVPHAGKVKQAEGVEGVGDGGLDLVPGATPCEQVEGHAIDELGGEEGVQGFVRVGQAQVVDAAEPGVVERSEGVEFEAQGGDELRGAGVQELECDGLVPDEVMGEEGGGGAAVAEGAFDAVAVQEQVAGLGSHGSGYQTPERFSI